MGEAMIGLEMILAHLVGDYIVQNDWMVAHKTVWQTGYVRTGHVACTVHCLMYTLSVWAFSWYWMPWWGLLLCFLVHWMIDRFRFAKWWMDNVSGQKAFASGMLSPWSIICVDNIFHLITLYGIFLLAKIGGSVP
jgi:hypothetical protein